MTMWVFGYGSLIWHPGFAIDARQIATLTGYARSFCMRSIHHRGTVAHPGLVLALDENASAQCQGVGFSVPNGQEAAVLAYLRERELISSAYLEKKVEVTLNDGRQVTAVTFVMDENHVQYCGGLDREEVARVISSAVGQRGPNTDYLFNTAQHLHDLGINDREIDWLAARVRHLIA